MTLLGGTVESAKKLREELRAAMIDLERIISSPSQAPTWIAAVHHRTRELQGALARHITEVESETGIMTRIVDDAPRLAGQADRLRQDHVELSDSIEHVLELAAGLGRETAAIERRALRDSALELLGALSRHRQRGVDFVYDAYDFDLGGQG